MDWPWDDMQAVVGAKEQGDGLAWVQTGRVLGVGLVNGFHELSALVAKVVDVSKMVTRLPIGARGEDMGGSSERARDGGEAWTLPV